MSRWFRHYAGMMRDEKLVRVAVKAGQTVERVIWVWGALLESASEVNDGGRYDFDADEAAYFLRCNSSDVGSILAGLEDSGRISEGVVAKWSDRQFDSDASRERQRRYRERRNNDAKIQEGDGDNAGGDGSVTSPDAGVTPQEYREQITDTDITIDDSARAPPKTEVSKDEEGELFAVAGKALSASPNLFVMATPIAWKTAGYDWLQDVIPAVRTTAQHCRPGSVKTWNYFTQSVVDWHAKRTATMPTGSYREPAPKRGSAALSEIASRPLAETFQ